MKKTLLFTWMLLAMGAGSLWAAEFNHQTHPGHRKAAECASCHEPGAASIVPDLKACLQCHEQPFIDEVKLPGLATHGPTWALNHRAAAKSKTIDCASCHTQESCLECHTAGRADEQGALGSSLANVHRSDFHITHPIAARTDPQLCSSCHEVRFCSSCHDSFNRTDLAILSHRRGWSDLETLPGTIHETYDTSECQTCHVDSVLPSHVWSSAHAREARKNLVTCQACHPQGDICLKCHSARSGLMINPHPKDWLDFSSRLEGASGGKTCRRCH